MIEATDSAVILAKEKGVDLALVHGAGADERVMKLDVQRWLKGKVRVSAKSLMNVQYDSPQFGKSYFIEIPKSPGAIWLGKNVAKNLIARYDEIREA